MESAVHPIDPSRINIRGRLRAIAPTSEKLFGALDIYRDVDSRSAAANMAIDEALLEIATQPTIRFYRWDHPALSFGYFGRFADVEKEKRDIVRRWTGGGIVFHGEDLTYSIVIPASDPAFGESSMSIYEIVHTALERTLSSFGQTAELAGEETPNAQRPTPNAQLKEMCFANAVRADVLLNGRKIAGAAQRRTRRGLLQQGSIQNVDLTPDFGEKFAAQLSVNCRKKMPSAAILKRAEVIAAQKYASAAWLERR